MTDTTTEHSEPQPAVAAPVEQPVRLDPERAAFNSWMDSPVAFGEAPEPWISDLAAEAAWQAWKHRSAQIEALRDRVTVLNLALHAAESALADIGDADREPGDDLAWCEARAAAALPDVRAALKA